MSESDCRHEWEKWGKPEPAHDYSPALAMWTTRLVQFRECKHCGETKARYVEISAKVG